MSSSSLIANPAEISAPSNTNSSSSAYSKSSRRGTAQKEEDDLAKAIALSLKDSNQTKLITQPMATAPSAPYAGLTFGSTNLDSSRQSTVSSGETKKVRAMYDFESVESNELTFKAGELIILQDDSDENWWKGENHRGTGLFPAHFVTKDLEAPVPGLYEEEEQSSSKRQGATASVAFQDEVKVIEYNNTGESSVSAVEISADKISRVLQFLETADPTGAVPDPPEMLALEAECYAMGPLIDEQLSQLDLQHLKFSELNKKVIDALNMYHKLMEQSPAAPVSFNPPPQPSLYGTQPGIMMPPNHLTQSAYMGQPQQGVMGPASYYGSAPMSQIPVSAQSDASADSSAKQVATAVQPSISSLPQGDFSAQSGFPPMAINGHHPQSMTTAQFNMTQNASLPPQGTPPNFGQTAGAAPQPAMYTPQSQFPVPSDPSQQMNNFPGTSHYVANPVYAQQPMQ